MVSLPLPSSTCNFGGEDAAAHLGPCKPGHKAHFALLVYLGVAEARHAEKLADARASNFFLMLRALLDHAAGNLAAYVADFTLEIANTSFTGVAANDFEDRIIGEGDILVAQAGLFALFLHQVLAWQFQASPALCSPAGGALPCGPAERAGMVCSTLAVATNSTCERS